MSQPSPFRRWAVTLVLAAAAVASIATSPEPTLEAALEAEPFTLTAAQPSVTWRVRVRLDLDKGLEGRDAGARLQLSFSAQALAAGQTPDAGTADAGSAPAPGPIVQLVVRDAASPEVELARGTGSAALDLMRDCAQRTCEQTLIVEWSLGEGSVSPVSVAHYGGLHTELAPDDGTATLELLP